MTDPQTTDLLLKIAFPILSLIGKKGLEKLLEEPPVEKAIQVTSRAFPEYDGLYDQLSKWCISKEFGSLLEVLHYGQRDIADDYVISEFMRIADFESEDGKEKAKEIIEYFEKALLTELYSTDQGIAVLASREEIQHGATRTEIQYLSAKIDTLLERSVTATTEDEVEKVEISEKEFHARIDEARDLLLKGKSLSAKSILLRMREETTDLSPSSELKFRIATNLGACAIDANDIDTIEAEFQEALRNKPDDEKALANAAVAAFLKGDYDQALHHSRRARDISEKNSAATTIYIQALSKRGLNNEVDQLFKEEGWIEKDFACNIAIGEVKFEAGLYKEAEEYARKSLSLKEDEPRALELLSRSIVLPIQTILQSEQPLRWTLPDEILDRLNEALAAQSEAIEQYKNFENPARLHLALINRSAILSYLGRHEDALKDCDRILQDDGANEVALGNKGKMLIRLDQFSQAISCFLRIKGEEREGILPYLAQAYFLNNQSLEVVSLLSPIWSEATDGKKLEIVELLLAAHLQLGNFEAIETITKELEEKWHDDLVALQILAHQKQRQGQNEAAIDIYKNLLELTSGLRKDAIRIELANLYYSLSEYGLAAQEYNQVVDETADLEILQKFVTSLYKSDQISEALSLARKIRYLKGAVPVITEIEIVILGSRLGDLPEAKKLTSELLEIESENYWHKLKLADICLRTGEKDEARAIIAEINVEEIRDPYALIEIARLRFLLKMEDILRFAYQARLMAFNDPEIHLAYVYYFLAREKSDEAILKKEEIDGDCVVKIKRGEVTEVYFISANQETDLANNILNANHHLSQKLLGHKRGDQIDLDGAWQIDEIQSKYVFAFQETLTKYPRMFPEAQGLQRIDDDENLSKMLSFVDRRHEHITEAQQLYFGRKIPLCTFAQIIRISTIEAWEMMVGSFGGRLISASGSSIDREEDVENISGAACVVMDVTALLTVGYLGLEEAIARRFDRIFVTQSVVVEVNNCLSKLDDLRPKMTVGKIHDEYIRHEITEEALEKERMFLEGITSFIRSLTEITPTLGALKVPKEKMSEFEENLGKSSIDVILVSEATKALLYSDDLALRALANYEWSIKGTSTLAVLLNLLEKKFINDDQYYDAITKLASANYEFISINADGLLKVLTLNGMLVNGAVAKIFQTLEGPECNEESAIIVCSELLKKLWLGATVMEHHRAWILDYILQVLITGRAGLNMIDRLKDAIRVKLRLVPWAQKDILRSIEIWRRQHFV